MLTTWRQVLEAEHFSSGHDVFLARERHTGPRMLFIDHYVPTWDRDSGSRRMFEYLSIFQELGFKVTLWPDNLFRSEPYTSQLQQRGIEVIYGRNSFDEYIHLYGRYFDVVYGCRASVMKKYMRALRRMVPRLKIVYDPHDLGFIRETRRAEVEGSRKALSEAKSLNSTEKLIMRSSDAIVAVSAREQELISSRHADKQCTLLQSIYDARPPTLPFSQRTDILFLGGFDHPPNVDAMQWFVREVIGIIRESLPDVSLDIVGSNPPATVMALASPFVRVVGYVENLDPCFESHRVFVAPLRYGAGEKGKIANSLSHGLPVVTTSVGAEGMAMVEGESVLVADTAREFAARVVRAYTDDALWERLSSGGLAYAEKYHGRATMKTRIEQMFHDLGVL
ncbi:MAG: glycosyltransferase, partial [Sulfobacillus sp.]